MVKATVYSRIMHQAGVRPSKVISIPENNSSLGRSTSYHTTFWVRQHPLGLSLIAPDYSARQYNFERHFVLYIPRGVLGRAL